MGKPKWIWTVTDNDERLTRVLIKEITELKKEIVDLKEGIKRCKINLSPNAIYSNKEIRLILNVDERLIKKYRDNGYLSYHRLGDKYWYKGKDVMAFLDITRYEAFAWFLLKKGDGHTESLRVPVLIVWVVKFV